MPLLALLERGAGDPPGKQVSFSERPDEFDFWDKYFKIAVPPVSDKPYFNLVTLRLVEQGFPHSNAATIRKNTFALKWHAAQRVAGNAGDLWTLSEDYSSIFRDKVLRKSGKYRRIPVVDLAVILLREQEFPDSADVSTLVNQFKKTFPQREADYSLLFERVDEEASSVFSDSGIQRNYDEEILRAMLPDEVTASVIPTPHIEMWEPLPLDDPILAETQRLLAFGTSGIILEGIPGTGKSYYSRRLAASLVKDSLLDVFRVQFHPSYGYEDFIEGYRPDEESKSGFRVFPKTFVQACERAGEVSANSKLVVLLIGEINRGDPARVFGEALTYIEADYRGEPFVLPYSGARLSVPANLLIIGTMNPLDRSIARADAAFVRRFDHISIEPSAETARDLLLKHRSFSDDDTEQIVVWFDELQRMVPFGVGHAFFANLQGLEHLKMVWRYRMRPVIEVALDLRDGGRPDVDASFNALLGRLDRG
jgi:hypothetical protein